MGTPLWQTDTDDKVRTEVERRDLSLEVVVQVSDGEGVDGRGTGTMQHVGDHQHKHVARQAPRLLHSRTDDVLTATCLRFHGPRRR